MNERISTRFDNLVLKSQSRLIDQVIQGDVSVGEFQTAIDNFSEASVAHAKARPGGVTQKEWGQLRKLLKQPSSQSENSPSTKNQKLFEALQDGSLEAKEALEELNWKTEQDYGEELTKRDGVIFQGERPKLRAHLFTGQSLKKTEPSETFVHPKLGDFLQNIKDIFPKLDRNKDQVIDRIEAREILSQHKKLGITASHATTFYSRQAEIASVHENKINGYDIRLEDLEKLSPHNHSSNISPDFEKAVTRISRRLDYEEGRQALEKQPFTLSQNFEPMNVSQGREGSCWILCNLPNLSSNEIGQLIKPEGDQYRLELKDGRSTLIDPLNEAERRIYSKGDGEWSGLLEKGFSQILAEDNRHITGGPAGEARELLTGHKPQQKNLLKRDQRPEALELRNRDTLFETLEQTLNLDRAVFASALPEDFEKGISEISAAGHGYTVMSIDREKDQVTLKNPWGRGEVADHDGVNDGLFTLTQNQFFANFSLLDIG